MANLTTISIFGKKYGKNLEYVKYSYTKDGEKFYQVRFRKGASNVPTEVGYLLITFDRDLVKKPREGKTITTKKGNTFKENDIIYLAGNLDWKIDFAKNEEYQKKQAENIANIF